MRGGAAHEAHAADREIVGRDRCATRAPVVMVGTQMALPRAAAISVSDVLRLHAIISGLQPDEHAAGPFRSRLSR